MNSSNLKLSLLSALALGSGLSLSGCVQEKLSPDFGVALRQDIAAQIADPDAHYTGTAAPGSDGSRAALAQDRYQKGTVIQPASAKASTVGAAPTGGATGPQ
jgi:type IV pilus biogenesis protein CpaD/CtpE